MKINTVDSIIQDFREGQNIFRRPSVELMVREISRLQARVQELEQERRWIPVSERLPEENGDYLILAFVDGIGDYYSVAQYIDGFFFDENDDKIDNISYWKSLTLPQSLSEEE